MSRRKPRNLRPDEKALWQKVVEKAAPLRPLHPDESSVPSHRPKPRQPQVSVPHFQVGERAKPARPGHNLSPAISDQVARAPVAMDRRSYDRMKKGRLSPEARIDLHGMTLAQAHPVLIRFILDNVALGRRLVLVITGKGRLPSDDGPIPMRHGVLRHQVPHWLHMAPLKPHVLQISEAHLKHGGQGAYYVYLRRNRQ